ncbi:hypothetical protein [Alteromonas gilva]|uniref:Peptidase M1 membrane alanine aminopeptidase domain-containing protein n=1 Tax=Alteromonas gilva TaxID=2987522 RepID=A0ABT5L554_9ALTE|nr:hypothetical protein [Alteromonas gilva]MDC8831992.1 hypothetical protein [Alteromonas gilva]
MCSTKIIISTVLLLALTWGAHSVSLTGEPGEPGEPQAPKDDKVGFGLQYQNTGVRFFSTPEIYSSAWGEHLNRALVRYTELIGAPSPVDVTLVATQAEAANVALPRSANRSLTLSLDQIQSKTATLGSEYAVIAHELCHSWFIGTLESNGLKQTKDVMGMPVYGHIAAPDWLDEAVAIHCESGDVAASRLTGDFKRALIEDFIVQEHPVFAAMKEKIMAVMKQKKAGQTTTITMKSGDHDYVSFYKQSAWFKRFLLATRGNDIFKDLVGHLADGDSLDQVILSNTADGSWPAVNRQFNQFIDNNQ